MHMYYTHTYMCEQHVTTSAAKSDAGGANGNNEFPHLNKKTPLIRKPPPWGQISLL